jgi:hypothetical protein
MPNRRPSEELTIDNHVRRILIKGWISFCGLLGVVAPTQPVSAKELTLPPAASERVEFQRDIRPIFAERCFSCHSADKHEGGLRLDRKADALAAARRVLSASRPSPPSRTV